MAHFGTESLAQLATCDPRLQQIANDAILLTDFSIIEGHRGEAAQNADYAKGVSKLKWPNGRHNATPSRAFDFAPYPIDWSSKTTALARFLFVSGVLYCSARKIGIRIRFGWDWNGNMDPRDETFLDWGHCELVDP